MADTVPATDEKVAFLSRPDTYPGPPGRVEVIETHMSWIFLAGEFAFKLKKPVAFPFLDFTDKAARHANCEAEMRLNRRLAPSIYLGVEPLTRDIDGAFRLGGNGEPVDWLVRMKRMPGERMLPIMVAEGRLTPAHIEELATVLAEFYRTAERPPIPPSQHLENLRQQQDWNRQTLERQIDGFDSVFARRHLRDLDALMERVFPLIEGRIQAGRYVDGHGDLRPEHVCFCDPVAIFDCLEFDDRLRFVDPFDELMFLALECELSGAGHVGAAILERTVGRMGESVSPLLLAFYKTFRATMRARMALSHTSPASAMPAVPWIEKAVRYLALAHGAVQAATQA